MKRRSAKLDYGFRRKGMQPFHKMDRSQGRLQDRSQGCRKHGSNIGAKVVGSMLGDIFLYYFKVKARREEQMSVMVQMQSHANKGYNTLTHTRKRTLIVCISV